MNKILITGFKHSGTTMLMALLRNHPQVGWIELETRYVEVDKPRKWMIMMAKKRVSNLKEKVWGEKIPWGDIDTGGDASRSIKFTKRWLKLFRKEARVLHIIRHPLDVAASGQMDMRPGHKVLKQIVKSVPAYIDFINNNLRSATIVYEDLVSNPQKHLTNIFDFCGLDSTKKVVNQVINTPTLKYGKINAERAFAFKKKGIESPIDYKKILERLCIRL